MAKTKETKKSLIYAMVTGPGSNHIDVSHFYPTLKEFFRRMKKGNLIEEYTLLTTDDDEDKVTGREGLSVTFRNDLSFLLSGYDVLRKEVIGILKKYEKETGACKYQGYNDNSVFGSNEGVCWYDIGACAGKAITNTKNLQKIEKILAEEGFLKSSRYTGCYQSRDDNPAITIKFAEI